MCTSSADMATHGWVWAREQVKLRTVGSKWDVEKRRACVGLENIPTVGCTRLGRRTRPRTSTLSIGKATQPYRRCRSSWKVVNRSYQLVGSTCVQSQAGAGKPTRKFMVFQRQSSVQVAIRTLRVVRYLTYPPLRFSKDRDLHTNAIESMEE
jgi:hypothetical protein